MIERNKSRWDKVGIVTSTLCAIHCALTPFAFTLLPIMAAGFLTNPWLEGIMISLAVLIAMATIARSYFFIHKQLMPLFFFAIGLMIIYISHQFTHGAFETILLPFGGLVIAFAHFLNIRLIKHSIKSNETKAVSS